MGGWVGGWISWKYSHLSPVRAGALTELGNKDFESNAVYLNRRTDFD